MKKQILGLVALANVICLSSSNYLKAETWTDCKTGNATCWDNEGYTCDLYDANHWYCAKQSGNWGLGTTTIWNYDPTTKKCGDVYEELKCAWGCGGCDDLGN